MSRGKDAGGKAQGFNVLDAVSKGRTAPNQPRSDVQKEVDAARTGIAATLRQQGTKSSAAFGEASRTAAEQRRAKGGLEAAPVARAGDISPRPANCAEEEGSGEGSAKNSPRGRSRSPSFKPFSLNPKP